MISKIDATDKILMFVQLFDQVSVYKVPHSLKHSTFENCCKYTTAVNRTHGWHCKVC